MEGMLRRITNGEHRETALSQEAMSLEAEMNANNKDKPDCLVSFEECRQAIAQWWEVEEDERSDSEASRMMDEETQF
jgi:hypothetical protein